MLRLVTEPVRLGTAEAKAAAHALGISPLVAQLLYARGAHDLEAMRAFLSPEEVPFHDPMLLPDMERALLRLDAALSREERIVVYGDYDVDGVCASAMLVRYLERLAAHVRWYIPSRLTDGYGMNGEAVRKLAQEGADLIITVDNGMSAIDEIKLCYELGVDVIVTDHHQPQGGLPACAAVVAPSREDSRYPATLCGAAVAWKLIAAHGGERAAMEYLVLAGLATVADVMPLLEENRAIVAQALRRLNAGDAPVGVLELAYLARGRDKHLRAQDLAFALAPRINAAGRMGEAGAAMRLLCTDLEEEARILALQLDGWNQARQQQEAEMLRQAREQLNESPPHRVILVHGPDWNPGIAGIVAARLAEEYYRPALVFAGEGPEVRGSARSIPEVNLYAALSAAKDHMTRFGGHEAAAGMSADLSRLPALSSALEAHLVSNYPDETFLPSCRYEVEADLAALTPALIGQLQLLEPYGEANGQPVFLTRDVELKNIRRMGVDGAHLKAVAMKNGIGCDLVAFGQGTKARRLELMPRADLLYHPDVNEYNGETRLQLRLAGLRRAQQNAAAHVEAAREYFFDAIFQDFIYNSKDSSPQPVRASLAELLREDVLGTLVLCFTPEGAADLLARLDAEALAHRIDVEYVAPPSGWLGNTALFAPRLDALTGLRFRNLLVYDFPASLAAPAVGARRLFQPDIQPSSPTLAALASLSRDGFSAAYAVLRWLGRQPVSAAAVLRQLEAAHLAPICAWAARRVFLELQFLEEPVPGLFALNPRPARRSLEESATYRALLQLQAAL